MTDTQIGYRSSNAMNPRIGLKWSAAFFTMFWTAGMLLWSGASNPANIVLTTIAGSIAGYLWYLMMHWLVIGGHGPVRQPDQG
jgi:hypothetical protein